MAWTSMDHAVPGWSDRLHQAAARLTGPGGYYNIGNAFGLGMGIALQASNTPADHAGMQAATDAAMTYLAGNPAATALTLGTAVFFWSGEMYHRAWANGAPPDPALNRRGDLLSGVGALILFVALLSLGHVMLAVTAGLLHAAGKFGSAWKWRPLPGWRSTWPDFFRTAVLASRVPAILASSFDLIRVASHADAATPASAWLTPLALLVCYALWCKADLMLFRASAKPAIARPRPRLRRPAPRLLIGPSPEEGGKGFLVVGGVPPVEEDALGDRQEAHVARGHAPGSCARAPRITPVTPTRTQAGMVKPGIAAERQPAQPLRQRARRRSSTGVPASISVSPARSSICRTSRNAASGSIACGPVARRARSAAAPPAGGRGPSRHPAPQVAAAARPASRGRVRRRGGLVAAAVASRRPSSWRTERGEGRIVFHRLDQDADRRVRPQAGVIGRVAALEAADRVGLDVVDDERGAARCPERRLRVPECAMMERDAQIAVGVELAAGEVRLARGDRIGNLEQVEVRRRPGAARRRRWRNAHPRRSRRCPRSSAPSRAAAAHRRSAAPGACR